MAEDAIAKAKAIAAKLRATSAIHSIGLSQDSDPSDPPGAKRKRWSSVDPGNDASSPFDKRPKSDNVTTKKVWIPVAQNPGYNYVGLLIGPGGSKQKALQAEAGGRVKIQVRGKGSSNSNKNPQQLRDQDDPLHVLLEGDQDCVDKAETLIKELLEDTGKADAEKQRQLESLGIAPGEGGGGNSLSTYKPMPVAQLINSGLGIYGPSAGAESIEEKMGVPNGVVGFVIGKGGESITSMQRRSGCRVQIQKEHEMAPGSNIRVITLTAASQDQITQCRSIIDQMVEERQQLNVQQSNHNNNGGTNQLQQALQLGQQLVTVSVPDADVGLVIGKGGISIRSIQERSGANIQIPTQADADNPMVRTCSVTHPTMEGANFAKQLVEEILKNKISNNGGAISNETSIQVLLPDKDVGMVIGRSGCVIREMQSKTRTRIQIPSQPTPGQVHRVATISGPAEGCQQVKQMIEMIILEQSSQSVMTGTNFTSSFVTQQAQNMAMQQQGGQAYANQYGAYGQQPNAYGQQQQPQQYAQYQQQYGAYAAAGQQQTGGGNAAYAASTTAAAGATKTDYSAEWAAYYAQVGQPAGGTAAATAAAATTPTPARTATAQATSTASAQATSTNAQQPDPKAYYDAFFRYAAYYGEEAARKYYTAWSPPVGTPNPYGSAAAASAAPSAASAEVPQQQQQQAATPVQQDPNNPVKDSSVRKLSNLPAWMTKSSS